MNGRGGTRARAAAALLVCALTSDAWALPARALSAADVAGTLNDEPVTLGEVDAALDGSIRRKWREIDQVARAAARGICADRALEQLTAQAGSDATTWRVDLWQQTRPADAEVERFSVQDSESPTRASALARHALHVRRYRRALADALDARLAGHYALQLPAAAASLDAEPALPPVVATCLGTQVTREDVERFAAFPLFRRRGEIVAATCRQFEIDYSNPLVLHRIAAARGMTLDELMASVEAQAGETASTDVEALARSRYGETDTEAQAKIRLALEATRRVEARMAFLEKIRGETRGACALELPEPPTVYLRRAPTNLPEAVLRVIYFGSFRCQQCEAGWQTLERLRRRWTGAIEVDFHHHFPDEALAWFEDALAAECSARQNRFWDYAAWRFSDAYSEGSAVKALGLDADAAKSCMDDPRTAVEILDDTEEALRLGFREAMPSWIIGRRPRRGFQSDAILDQTIRVERAGAGTLDPLSGGEQHDPENP